MIQGDAIRNITGGSSDSPNSGAYYYGALADVALEEPESLQARDYADDLLSILTPAGSFLRPPKIAP